jgi:ABC-type lipoprotein export system ATPase subunit
MTPVVAIDALEKWWTPESGLRPVSFELRAGEVVVVRGRSGSGKSTLLAMLAGWVAPDAGTISMSPELAERADEWSGIAIVPQVLALVPELTVGENVAMAGGDAAAALAALDLVDLADRSPSETSLGQQQRTALARAVVAQPLLLLVDEPTSHQDPHHVDAVLRALQDAAAKGSAVLVATHEQAVVDAATRVVDLAT